MLSPIKNTLTVWNALFLREALDRFFGSRAAWVWLIFEPALHLVVIASIRAAITRSLLCNVDVFVWICVGLLAFFLFRRTAIQVQHAVDCNKAFFAFRQVRPFDAAISRGLVEAFSMFIVSLILLIPLAFFDKQVIPNDPFLLIVAMGSLWLLGLGYGLITSTIQHLVPESSHVFGLLFTPLYFLSGAIIYIRIIPQPYREWLMYNPLAHALEIVRYSFIDHYPVIEGTSLAYVFKWVLLLAIIGLVFYKLLEKQLIRR